MNTQLLNTVDWRKYLIEDNDNPRIKKFLESRGNSVFVELTRAVNFANKNGRDKIVLIVHPNAGNAILIKETEYMEVYDIAMKYFEKNENYEACSLVSKYKTNFLKRKSKKRLQNHKNLT
jgi:aconitase A|tara:strand:- start:1721 stop:2080 length:360 start_codon:yes stop_codon:yes gene_type:complete